MPIQETPNHKLRHPQGGDPAKHALYYEYLAEDVERELDDIDIGTQLAVPGSSDGKLIIVKDGAAAYKAMSGDGTIDEDGVFQLGPKVVGTGEMGDKVVTTAKLDDGAVTPAKVAVTTAWATIPLNEGWGGSESPKPQYRLNNDLVELRGIARAPKASSKIGTLPAGHRPEEGQRFVTTYGAFTAAIVVLTVESTGDLTLSANPGEGVIVFLDPVRFAKA